MACLRESPLDGRVGIIPCDEEGCLFGRITNRSGSIIADEASEADCLLQSRLRAGDSENFEREVDRRGPGRLEFPPQPGGDAGERFVDWDIDTNRPLYTSDYFEGVIGYKIGDQVYDPRDVTIIRKTAVGEVQPELSRVSEHEDTITARWADIEDPKEQFEVAFGIKLEKWQWDYIEHLRRGEVLARDFSKRGSGGYKWVPDSRVERPQASGDP